MRDVSFLIYRVYKNLRRANIMVRGVGFEPTVSWRYRQSNVFSAASFPFFVFVNGARARFGGLDLEVAF